MARDWLCVLYCMIQKGIDVNIFHAEKMLRKKNQRACDLISDCNSLVTVTKAEGYKWRVLLLRQ